MGNAISFCPVCNHFSTFYNKEPDSHAIDIICDDCVEMAKNVNGAYDEDYNLIVPEEKPEREGI